MKGKTTKASAEEVGSFVEQDSTEEQSTDELYNKSFNWYFSQLMSAGDFVKGSGASEMECVIDILDKSAFFPLAHYGEDLSKIQNAEEIQRIKPYMEGEFDNIHEKMVFTLIAEKDRLVTQTKVSRRTIHSREMSKKTYITAKETLEEFDDSIAGKSKAYIVLYSLLQKGYITIIDKVPHYPIEDKTCDIKTIVLGDK